ncbi:hypothetical protein [uncultured Tenacibaculum sp.]|uniref:hypothetical protein n=1 Tax=uncultured Tenacibaculum sp. TaxID=174713 RepID=UPI0026359D9D|nr:hypothetical protein [uncultured Tenacibaculum sp.]
MLKTTTKNLLLLILLSMLQFSCSNNDQELVKEETKPKSLLIEFELNGKPISINFPITQNTGIGIRNTKLQNPEGTILAGISETFSNDDYHIQLYFDEYFSNKEYSFNTEENMFKLPWEDFKTAMYSNDNFGIKYIDYKESYKKDLNINSHKGFTIKIKDIKNNKTYTSLLFETLYSTDTNNSYEYNKLMKNSFFKFISSEKLEDDTSGFNKNYEVKATFECKLLDYTKNLDGGLVINDIINLTNGKIVGVL